MVFKSRRNKMKFTFGSDPEFVLKNKKNPISAIGILPSKSKAIKINGCNCYYDNVLAECTVKPARNEKEAIKVISNSVNAVKSIAEKNNLFVHFCSSIVYPKSQLKHPHSKKIGCARDMCVYTLTQPEPPESVYNRTGFRSVGGHIHLGCKFLKDDIYNVIRTVRMMDLFLSIPSLFIDKSAGVKERREIYGQAGRFRVPEHGLEYRTLGNFWLEKPELIQFTYDVCNFVLDFVKSNKDQQFWEIQRDIIESDDAWEDPNFNPINCHICHEYDSKEFQKVINQSNVKNAERFLKIVKTHWTSDINKQFESLIK